MTTDEINKIICFLAVNNFTVEKYLFIESFYRVQNGFTNCLQFILLKIWMHIKNFIVLFNKDIMKQYYVYTKSLLSVSLHSDSIIKVPAKSIIPKFWKINRSLIKTITSWIDIQRIYIFINVLHRYTFTLVLVFIFRFWVKWQKLVLT